MTYQSSIWTNTLPTNDVIFKEIFETSEGSKERLKSLINAALQIDDLEVQDVEDLEILSANSTHITQAQEEVFSGTTRASLVGRARKRYVDVRVKDRKTEKEFIVEVQIGFKDSDFSRFNRYAYKAFIETMKPVYLIAFCSSINEGESCQQYGSPKYQREYTGIFQEHFKLSPVKVLKDFDVHGLKKKLSANVLIEHSKEYAEHGVTKIFIDIDQYAKISESKDLKDIAEFLKKGAMSSEKSYLKTIENKYRELVSDPQVQKEIEERKEDEEYGSDLLKEERKKGKEEGLKEGEKKKAIEIAKGLLASGIDKKVVAKTTGLSSKEIAALK